MKRSVAFRVLISVPLVVVPLPAACTGENYPHPRINLNFTATATPSGGRTALGTREAGGSSHRWPQH